MTDHTVPVIVLRRCRASGVALRPRKRPVNISERDARQLEPAGYVERVAPVPPADPGDAPPEDAA